jgi:hypothetical protein
MPVAAVEIEVSLQVYGRETKDGKQLQLSPFQSGKFINVPGLVIASCKERGISVVAYS